MSDIQAFEAVQAALADLQRSGVSDVVCDDVFDFSSSKLGDVKHLTFKVSQQIQIDRQAQTQEVVQNAAAQLDVKKPKEVPFAVGDYVWSAAESHEALVLISTPFSKGEEPLSAEASRLFEKMLTAIDLSSDKVAWLMIKDENASGKPHKSANAAKIKEKVQSLLAESASKHILLVGQSCGKILFGENLSALRKKDVELSGKRAVALCHPNMLLKQPALKRMAWQDLLKFKEGCA